jgi:hypothetical protein
MADLTENTGRFNFSLGTVLGAAWLGVGLASFVNMKLKVILRRSPRLPARKYWDTLKWALELALANKTMANTRPSDWFEIVNKHDPWGFISMGAPDDEYIGQIGAVQEDALNCVSLDELLDSLYQAFSVPWIPDTNEREYFRALAVELWEFLPGWQAKERQRLGVGQE